MPSGRNQRSKFFACCSASNSVGAMSAACKSAAHRARSGRGRHHGLAAAHVALHQPHHGPVRGEIAIDFGERARLRAGERERQRLQQSLLEARRVAQGFCRIRLDVLAQQPQRKLVRQQFFEGQAALRRVASARAIRRDPRRAADDASWSSASSSGGRSSFASSAGGIQSRTPEAAASRSASVDERAQPRLRHAFGGRVDRREDFLERRGFCADAPVFGMHDLETQRAAPHSRRNSACACRESARPAARRRSRRSAASGNRCHR